MPYNNPAGLIAAAVILSVLSTTCVGLRFYARSIRKAKFSIDDWLLVPALALCWAEAGLIIWGCSPGVKAFGVPTGVDLADAGNRANRVLTAAKIEYILQCLEPFTVGLIKLSIVFFYLRIFGSRGIATTWQRTVLIVWIGILASWMITFTLALPLQCGTDPWVLWTPVTTIEFFSHCSHNVKIGFAFYGSDMATDVITVLLPLPMLYSLQMPLHRKIGVFMLFLLAALSVGASIGSLYIYYNVDHNLAKVDEIIALTSLVTWHLIETHVGIIAASLPVIRPVVQVVRDSTTFSRLLSSLPLSRITGSRVSKDTKDTKETLSQASSSENFVSRNKSSHVSTVQGGFASPEVDEERRMGNNVHVQREVMVETQSPSTHQQHAY